MSGVVIVTHARPDPGNLVRSDRHPNSATADQDSPLYLMLVEGQCDGFGKVRVVHRCSAICTEIEHLVVDPQAQLDELLELEAGMISGERNPHGLPRFFIATFRTVPLPAHTAHMPLNERTAMPATVQFPELVLFERWLGTRNDSRDIRILTLAQNGAGELVRLLFSALLAALLFESPLLGARELLLTF